MKWNGNLKVNLGNLQFLVDVIQSLNTEQLTIFFSCWYFYFLRKENGGGRGCMYIIEIMRLILYGGTYKRSVRNEDATTILKCYSIRNWCFFSSDNFLPFLCSRRPLVINELLSVSTLSTLYPYNKGSSFFYIHNSHKTFIKKRIYLNFIRLSIFGLTIILVLLPNYEQI